MQIKTTLGVLKACPDVSFIVGKGVKPNFGHYSNFANMSRFLYRSLFMRAHGLQVCHLLSKHGLPLLTDFCLCLGSTPTRDIS